MPRATQYANECDLEPVKASDHDHDNCPNCGSEYVVENRHGTVDELDIECAGCGRARGEPTMPNHFAELKAESKTGNVARLAELIKQTTAARGVDVWAVEEVGLTASEWADLTGRSRSTVSRNIRRANGDE